MYDIRRNREVIQIWSVGLLKATFDEEGCLSQNQSGAVAWLTRHGLLFGAAVKMVEEAKEFGESA